MTNWTNTFSGSAVKPSIVSYQSIVMAANTALAWPTESLEGVPYVAAAIDVTASAGGLILSMPSALNGGTGVAAMITNVGANSFTVQDASGNAIAVLTAGQSWVIVLKDNTTVAGQWRAIQLAATTSNANAAALAGAGLQANGATLQTNDVTVSLAVNTLIDSTHRAKVIVWTGAAGTLTLDTLAHVGAGWNCWIMNEGTGALTIATSGADVINTGVATLQIPAGTGGNAFGVRVSAAAGNYNIGGSVPVPLPPNAGGTGVSNDATNTITFAGHFGFTATLTAATSVTFPTAGTLAILGPNTFTGTQTMAADLLFTDATYDIGKVGATRPRDGFFSRNLTAGTNVTAAGIVCDTISYKTTAVTFTGSNTGLNPNSIFQNSSGVGNVLCSQFQISAFAPNDGTNQFWRCDDSATTRAKMLSNGGLSNFSANNVNLSDARVKPEAESLASAGAIPALWDAHKTIAWSRFKYYDQTHDDWNYGYIAQDVQAIMPTLVDNWDDESDLLGVYQEDLHNIGHAVLAEAQRRIEAQQMQIDALVNRLKLL